MTIGNFDGVHKGHQFIIEEIVQKELFYGDGFDRGHVSSQTLRISLAGLKEPFYLTTPEEKTSPVMKGLGVERGGHFSASIGTLPASHRRFFCEP